MTEQMPGGDLRGPGSRGASDLAAAPGPAFAHVGAAPHQRVPWLAIAVV